MSDTQELKEALIKMDIDTVIALTGLSYENAADKCEQAEKIYESIMGCIRAGQDSTYFEEQLSDLVNDLLSISR